MVLGAASLLLVTITAGPRAQDASHLQRPADPPASTVHWQEAPEFIAVFAPRLYRDSYRAFIVDLDLASVLRQVIAEPAARAVASPGAWHAAPESALDAFGAGGLFDRSKMARLYGSARPIVARGPRGADGIVEESWTLLSPYPSVDLERLHAGTLLIAVRIP